MTTSHSLFGNSGSTTVDPIAEWFEGFDGQVVLEDEYVWIVRDGVPATLVPGSSRAPRRAPRRSVIGTDFSPASDGSFGYITIRVKGTEVASGSDVVRFSEANNQRFALLDRTLAPRAEIDEQHTVEPPSIVDRLRVALDDLGGIATQSELAEIFGDSPDVTDEEHGVTWGRVGSTWVATGGSDNTAAAIGSERLRTLDSLIRRLPTDTGIKALRNAVAESPLHHLDPQRLGALWEAVISEFHTESAISEDLDKSRTAPVDLPASSTASPEPQRNELPSPPKSTVSARGATTRSPSKSNQVSGPKALAKLNEVLRTALDAREGLATHAELTRALGVEVPTRGSHKGVIWGQVGGVRVAAGGTNPLPIRCRIAQIRELNRFVKHSLADTEQQELIPAPGGEPAQISASRFSELFRAIESHFSGRAALSIERLDFDRSDSPGVPGEVSRSSSGVAPSIPPKLRDEAATERNDESHRVVVPSEGLQEDARSARPIRPSVSAFSGQRMRVYLDCDGHRIKALYDPDGRSVEVTVVPIRALQGARFDDPHTAAAVVISACRPGDAETHDGWSLWHIDDRTGRALGEVRDLRRTR